MSYLLQLEHVYDQLQSLSEETLVKIIGELGIPDNDYKEVATMIYVKAKLGKPLSEKQKRVLVNVIGQIR